MDDGLDIVQVIRHNLKIYPIHRALPWIDSEDTTRGAQSLSQFDEGETQATSRIQDVHVGFEADCIQEA